MRGEKHLFCIAEKATKIKWAWSLSSLRTRFLTHHLHVFVLVLHEKVLVLDSPIFEHEYEYRLRLIPSTSKTGYVLHFGVLTLSQ